MLSKSLRINFLNKSVGWKIFSKSLPIFLLCFFIVPSFRSVWRYFWIWQKQGSL